MAPLGAQHSIVKLINTHLAFRSASFPSSKLFDADLNTALSKFQQDPSTLTAAELKSLLRCIGLPVSGNKAELLDRLTATGDNIDESVYDVPPKSEYVTENMDFDNVGRDPASLVGLRIKRFEYDFTALRLFTDGGCVTIAVQDPRSNNPGLELDEVLWEGLSAVADWKFEVRDHEVKVVERDQERQQSRGLLIVEGAAAMRKGKREKYRVVGVRCENMVEMGYVSARDQGEDDADLLEHVRARSGGVRHSGVAVASGLDGKGYTFFASPRVGRFAAKNS